MKFGFSLIMRGAAATPEAFRTMAERAEALELDSVWCSDHLVIPPRTVSRYPGTADGTFPDTWLERYWEPFTVLSHLAACTRRLTLGMSVCILPMRNPVEVAAELADLDQLSGGRVVFGVGVGWFAEEFAALGWPFAERGRRTNEGLEICKALWTQERPSYHGRHYAFDEVYFGPRPVQRPHPPIWIAGHSPGALRRVARLGDGWHPFRPSVETVQRGRDELARLLAAEGRRAEDVTLTVKGHLDFRDSPPAAGQWPLEGRPQDIVDGLRRFRDLGVAHATLDFRPETLEQGLEAMERFVQDIRPHL